MLCDIWCLPCDNLRCLCCFLQCNALFPRENGNTQVRFLRVQILLPFYHEGKGKTAWSVFLQCSVCSTRSLTYVISSTRSFILVSCSLILVFRNRRYCTKKNGRFSVNQVFKPHTNAKCSNVFVFGIAND